MNSFAKQFHVVYREEDGWFIATVPNLSGCHTQGKTLAQAETRIKEAIEVFLESIRAHKQPTPRSGSRVFLSSVLIGQ